MKLNAFWKGLIMAVVGFIATTISDLETFNIAYISIATLGFTIVYVIKNAVFPSVSIAGIIDLKDIISGFILVLGMALSSFAAQLLTTGFTWNDLWVAISGAAIGYVLKTLSQKPK